MAEGRVCTLDVCFLRCSLVSHRKHALIDGNTKSVPLTPTTVQTRIASRSFDRSPQTRPEE